MTKKATIIVIGNEKGGAGKTTTAMNIITALLYMDFNVVSIDTDVRQLSLTRYMENRVNSIDKLDLDIPLPTHYKIDNIEDDPTQEIKQLNDIISQTSNKADFIVIDTAGACTKLSRYSHSIANKIVTPINDSFVDIDLLANIDGETLKVIRPGVYSQMVWEEKINKAKNSKESIDWVVVRNKISHVKTNNKRNIEKVVADLSKRVGCRLVDGFGDRVIFKELFLKGLTLLDIRNEKLKSSVNLTLSHITAKHELLRLLDFLGIRKENKEAQRTTTV